MKWLLSRYPWLKQINWKVWIQEGVKILLLTLIAIGVLKIAATAGSIECMADNSDRSVITTEVQVNGLSQGMSQYISDVCKDFGVNEELALAYIETVSGNNPQLVTRVDTSGDGNPDIVRYGLFQLHSDLLAKYDNVVESAWGNAYAGIERLAWALEDNGSLQGALMAHYYTKPVAQEMWRAGVKSTDIIDAIISNYERRKK